MSGRIVGGTPYGRGDALIDTADAVLLEEVTVVVLGVAGSDGAGRAIGMELAGRVNKTPRRSSVLYVFDADGAAAIVSQLLGLAARVSSTFLEDLLARVRRLP